MSFPDQNMFLKVFFFIRICCPKPDLQICLRFCFFYALSVMTPLLIQTTTLLERRHPMMNKVMLKRHSKLRESLKSKMSVMKWNKLKNRWMEVQNPVWMIRKRRQLNLTLRKVPKTLKSPRSAVMRLVSAQKAEAVFQNLFQHENSKIL